MVSRKSSSPFHFLHFLWSAARALRADAMAEEATCKPQRAKMANTSYTSPCAPPPKAPGTLRPALVSARGARPCLLSCGSTTVARMPRDGGSGATHVKVPVLCPEPSARGLLCSWRRFPWGEGEDEIDGRDVRAITSRMRYMWWRPRVAEMSSPSLGHQGCPPRRHEILYYGACGRGVDEAGRGVDLSDSTAELR